VLLKLRLLKHLQKRLRPLKKQATTQKHNPLEILKSHSAEWLFFSYEHFL
jgi:hypothetical protein